MERGAGTVSLLEERLQSLRRFKSSWEEVSGLLSRSLRLLRESKCIYRLLGKEEEWVAAAREVGELALEVRDGILEAGAASSVEVIAEKSALLYVRALHHLLSEVFGLPEVEPPPSPRDLSPEFTCGSAQEAVASFASVSLEVRDSLKAALKQVSYRRGDPLGVAELVGGLVRNLSKLESLLNPLAGEVRDVLRAGLRAEFERADSLQKLSVEVSRALDKVKEKRARLREISEELESLPRRMEAIERLERLCGSDVLSSLVKELASVYRRVGDRISGSAGGAEEVRGFEEAVNRLEETGKALARLRREVEGIVDDYRRFVTTLLAKTQLKDAATLRGILEKFLSSLAYKPEEVSEVNLIAAREALGRLIESLDLSEGELAVFRRVLRSLGSGRGARSLTDVLEGLQMDELEALRHLKSLSQKGLIRITISI